MPWALQVPVTKIIFVDENLWAEVPLDSCWILWKKYFWIKTSDLSLSLTLMLKIQLWLKPLSLTFGKVLQKKLLLDEYRRLRVFHQVLKTLVVSVRCTTDIQKAIQGASPEERATWMLAGAWFDHGNPQRDPLGGTRWSDGHGWWQLNSRKMCLSSISCALLWIPHYHNDVLDHFGYCRSPMFHHVCKLLQVSPCIFHPRLSKKSPARLPGQLWMLFLG